MNLATEPAGSRRDAFAIAAERRGLLPLVIEKDFWVCWALERLFSLPEFAEHLLFKGGTSLSKVYGLIQRFSEDIDLSLSRACLETGLADPEQAASSTQRKLRSQALVAAFHRTVTNRLLPALRAAIAAALGEDGWVLTQDADDAGTLHFRYPRAMGGDLDYGNLVHGNLVHGNGDDDAPAYIAPEVRIELGGRSDDWPAERKTVTPYVAQELPQAAPGAVAVRVLAARRTFWEKATILHAEYHRPPDKAAGERLSRHYSDLAQMAGTDAESQALADLALLARVRLHKATFYTAPWASYETAVPGTLRLLPRQERLTALRADYRGMEAMFFQRPVVFDTVLERLAALESRINALAEQHGEPDATKQ